MQLLVSHQFAVLQYSGTASENRHAGCALNLHSILIPLIDRRELRGGSHQDFIKGNVV